MTQDRSNGYESIADLFINSRGRAVNGVGTSAVRSWAKTLKSGGEALDLGCGTGIPSTMILIEAGMKAYAVDASPSMVSDFQKNFPQVPVACEPVEDSMFFGRVFDSILAWGLLFLLPAETQEMLIPKMAAALKPGGRLLFTSPPVIVEWDDAMTGERSRSLGAERYKELMAGAGLSLIDEFEDEGENHYYHAIRL